MGQLIPQQLRREPVKALRVCIMPTMKYWEVIAEKLSGAGGRGAIAAQ